jgi:hypothetical protein
MLPIDPQYQFDKLTNKIEGLIGYRPTQEELDNFPFQIYNFIIRSIRDRDQDEKSGGTNLLKRFLEGPQELWISIYNAASKLQTLFSPTEVEAQYLFSLMRLVGFGRELSEILFAITNEDERRKIVAGGIAFWYNSWINLGLVTAIRLVTGNRFKIRGYFDFRFIVNETSIEEDLQNTDPYMLSVKTKNFFRGGSDGATFNQTFSSIQVLPTEDDINGIIEIYGDTGSPSNDGVYNIVDVDVILGTFTIEGIFPRADTGLDFYIKFLNDDLITEIRIVDEKIGQGELNRDLLIKLLEAQRPNSERFDVVYIDFLDLFQINGDLGQWDNALLGDISYSVNDGALSIVGGGGFEGGITTNRSTTTTWKNHQWKSKVALKTNGAIALGFYDYTLRLVISYNGFGTGYMELQKKPGASWLTVGSSVPLPSLNLDTFWTYTIETTNLGSNVISIKVLFDGNKLIEETTSHVPTAGNIYFVSIVSAEFDVEETELWVYPLDITRVGPNP